jgi:hypothetical protein
MIERVIYKGLLKLGLFWLVSLGGFSGLVVASAAADKDGIGQVPGVVIDHSPASSGLYIGSPSLASLSNGDYLASHDFFGPNSGEFQTGWTVVFRSPDHGRTWRKVSEIQGAFWSTLFVHRGVVYLIGPDRHHGNVVIRRSIDGGATWTSPTNSSTGLLSTNGQYHCAPMPIIEHNDRLWRAMERRDPPEGWGSNYRAGMLSVSLRADLLMASNWTFSRFLASDRAWNGGDMGAWLEGNAIVTPSGELVDVLRVQTRSWDERAAMVNVSSDGTKTQFDPATGFISFLGGAKKFTIRFDAISKRYWSLVNAVPAQHRAENPSGIRNTLALVSSIDLRNWETRCIVLYHPDQLRHAFQYVDWLIENNDLIAVSRTAFDDAEGGAHSAHDANFLTFHRITNFRTKTIAESAPITGR